jgi:hypothetical protein
MGMPILDERVPAEPGAGEVTGPVRPPPQAEAATTRRRPANESLRVIALRSISFSDSFRV